MYSIIFVLGVFTFNWEVVSFLNKSEILVTVMFCLIIIFLGAFSSVILKKESSILLKMGERYTALLLSLGNEKFADLSSEKTFNIKEKKW